MAVAVDSVNSFITLAQARAFLDLEDGDTERDDDLALAINHAARLFNTYCGFGLKSRAYIGLLFDGDGTDEVYLPAYPINTAETFTLYADADRLFATALTRWPGTGSSSSYEYMLDETSGLLTRLDGDSWPSGHRVLKVTMTAGFSGAEGGDGGDLAHAQLRQVAEFYHQVGLNPALRNFSLGGVSQGLGDPGHRFGVSAGTVLLPDVQSVLAAYRIPHL